MSPRQINLESAHRELETETVHAARVMSPWEMDSLVKDVMDDVRAAAPDNAPHLPKLEAAIEQYVNQWQGIYARHGEDEAGDAAYRQAMEQLVSQAGMFAGQWKLANGVDAAQALYQTIVADALRDRDGQPVVVLPPNLRQQARHQAGGSAAVQPAQQEAHENRAPAPGAPARAPASSPATDGASQAAADPARSPLRSVHTASLPQLLKQTGSSVLVSTYQAGKLAVLRANNDKLNTHFRVYNRPMGLAHSGGRLALGTASTVEFYYNMAAVAPSSNLKTCMTPPSCRGVHTSPATSTFTKWPTQAMNCGWSTPSSPACARWMNTTALCRAGDPNSSAATPPKIAATSTDWRWWTAGPNTSPRSAPPTRPGAGAKTRPAAACSWMSNPMKSSAAACPCRIRRAGTRAGCGCLNQATARWPRSTPTTASLRWLPNCPALPAA